MRIKIKLRNIKQRWSFLCKSVCKSVCHHAQMKGLNSFEIQYRNTREGFWEDFKNQFKNQSRCCKIIYKILFGANYIFSFHDFLYLCLALVTYSSEIRYKGISRRPWRKIFSKVILFKICLSVWIFVRAINHINLLNSHKIWICFCSK